MLYNIIMDFESNLFIYLPTDFVLRFQYSLNFFFENDKMILRK